MGRTITQRELRNYSGAVLRDVQAGETITVTRNGTPTAELRPIPSPAVRAPAHDRRLHTARVWVDYAVSAQT